jgi:hypothetical protein
MFMELAADKSLQTPWKRHENNQRCSAAPTELGGWEHGFSYDISRLTALG